MKQKIVAIDGGDFSYNFIISIVDVALEIDVKIKKSEYAPPGKCPRSLAERYASQVQKEQKCLPILASHLSFTIRKPLALGKPSKDYLWNWSVFKYIKGESSNFLTINELHFKSIASKLAQFLNELHKVDQAGGPFLDTHNFYLGGSLQVYDTETKLALSKLQGFTNIEAAKSIC